MESDRIIRNNITVSGMVQRVGYRHIVQGIARKNRITGCIRNLLGYDVQIIAEGSIDDISKFKSEIKVQEYPVQVDSLEITEEDPTGEYQYFEVIRGSPDEELAERFDTAIAILGRMEKKQDLSLGMHKDSISLQKESIGLQKETIGLQMDTISLQKETLDEVKGIRQDLHKTLNQEIAEMREELREMRAALIQAGIMRTAVSL
ncbi:MAG: acylphosphatase [Methanobacteriota archaeon]